MIWCWAASSFSIVTNLGTTAEGGPSIDSKAIEGRAVSVRFASWPLPTQAETASPSTSTATTPKQRPLAGAFASVLGRPNPVRIDFPVGPAILLGRREPGRVS